MQGGLEKIISMVELVSMNVLQNQKYYKLIYFQNIQANFYQEFSMVNAACLHVTSDIRNHMALKCDFGVIFP